MDDDASVSAFGWNKGYYPKSLIVDRPTLCKLQLSSSSSSSSSRNDIRGETLQQPSNVKEEENPGSSSSSSSSSNSILAVEDKDDISGTWSQWQDWALVDNLPNYLLQTENHSSKENGVATGTRRLAARWRSLMRDVTELAGYDVEFAQKRYKMLLEDATLRNVTSLPCKVVPSVLPLLERYSFDSDGDSDSLTGYAYGIPGVADGTKVTTPKLRGLQVTLPQGWVESEDCSIMYELGTSAEESSANDFYSLDFAKAAGISNSISSVSSDKALVNLGAMTGLLLASAAAINTISHHVSVHVYWI